VLPDNYRRNFFVLTVDGLLFFLGMIFISYESVVPVFLARLGASKTAIALIPVAQAIGINTPSMFSARHVETMQRKFPWVRGLGFVQRAPWAIIALLVFLLGDKNPRMLIIALLAAITISTSSAGLLIPGFFDIVASTMPLEKRGLLFAMRSVLSYLFGMGGGLLVKVVLDRISYPASYGFLYVIGTAVLFMGWVSFLFIKEPVSVPISTDGGRPPRFREAATILRDNRSYLLYNVSRALLIISFAGTAFFPVYLVERHGLPVSVSGVFALITAATFVLVNPILGRVADRIGYKPVFIVSFVSLSLAAILGLVGLPQPVSYVLIFFTALSQSVNMFAFNMTMEFAPPGQVPTYIGITGFLVGLVAPLAVLTGRLVDHFGYGAVFLVTGITAVAGLVVMALGVEEPRVATRRLNQPDTAI
jgi:hypothetical protein